jgi:hypothetical protein
MLSATTTLLGDRSEIAQSKRTNWKGCTCQMEGWRLRLGAARSTALNRLKVIVL